MKKLAALQQLARAHRIHPSYVDIRGRTREASNETLRRMLELLEVPSDLPEVIFGKTSLEPVYVQWDQRPLKITLPPALKRVRAKIESSKALPTIRGSVLTVPALPFGYHTLRIENGKGRKDSLVISAPTKTYSNPELARSWGIFLPMYALHSRRSWGAGNFTDWQNFCEWIADQGGTVAGTLPVLATFLDQPICEPSPYSPGSRLFWNEFYVDPTAAPELADCSAAKRLIGGAGFKRKLAHLRKSEFVDYSGEYALRRRVLELVARHFFETRGSRFEKLQAFLRKRIELENYAAFRATCDHLRTSWRNWPAQLRGGKLSRYPAELRDFYLYTQFLAQEQMDRISQTCRERGVNFYLDLPLGVNSDSFDMWRYREFFAQGASAGAPPDAFFTKGQNWGFAPLHPRRMRENHYRYVIDYLRFQMRQTGLLRIDHVMGLHRLYWVPQGLPASEGAYVSYPAHELYAILSVESHLHKTMIVGENLGTVPPEVNESMDRHGLRRMYVAQYDQRCDAREALPKPPGRALATINTHDMPPFAAHWKGLDIDDRADLGLVPPGDVKKQHAARRRMHSALVSFLRKKGFLADGCSRDSWNSSLRNPGAADVLKACLQFLAQSEADIVLINLEDLWLETRSQNVPGTSTERPNWRRKAKYSFEEILADRRIRGIVKMIRQSRQAID
jgi:4-alpha-glucanotransferase